MLKQSFTRIYKAFGYSMLGLKAAFKHERAFKEETLLLILAIVLAIFLDITLIERGLLIGSILFMMIVELINSAIEAVVDRIGAEKHELSGQAKDMGSAAVLLTSILVIAIWGYILISHFFDFI